ncbi:MAG: FAD:protein FMN transferase [Chloroflexi bacterium]|nr:FAD:protein FMN transferase [Chloroflexota bacterium]
MTPATILPPADPGTATDWATAAANLMGGRVSVHVRPVAGDAPEAGQAAASQALARIGAWADRLTRFDDTSELSRLNAAPAALVGIGPTLTAVLDWGRGAEAISDGVVDIGLLDARLLAEDGDLGGDLGDRPAGPAARRWSLLRHRRGAMVDRPIGLRFDLDGVAKGWLADRALDLLPGVSAVVDADGDIAVRVVDDEGCRIGVADPRDPRTQLATLRLERGGDAVARFGVATSGTSVHRWTRAGRTEHHLIDPRTCRPARTDILQATVIARTARAAEAFAKTAVIVGSRAAASHLDRAGVLGQILVTESGDVLVTPATLEFLA